MSTVHVRRARVADAAAYARIMSHPEVLPQLLQLPFTDEEVWHARLTEMLAVAPGKADLPLVAELDGEVVGTAGLHPLVPAVRRRHAMGLGMGVAPAAQGRGVGSALMRAMCDYADDWAQVLRLELIVYADNERAIRLYQRFGFEVEGTHRAYALQAGRYVDALSMARLHPRPPMLPA